VRTIFMVEASGDIANLSNDESQDPDQNKIDPEGNNNDLTSTGVAEEPEGSGDDKLDGITDVNAEPDFAAGAVQSVKRLASGRIVGANSDELATEPMGYDDNDMDDFNTGTTGPTITQTDINPDNSFSGSKRLGQWTGSLDGLTSAIQGALSDDLRNKEYQGDSNPLTGHCYVASEAAYHLLGGKAAGWKPKFFSQGRHWWLENEDGRHLDVTAGQFPGPYPYENGKGKGFLTAQPSKRAQVVIDRVQGRKTASWNDVQSKAQRIYKQGGIRIISVTGPYVTAHVQGDDGVYETTLQRGKTGSIDQWTCSCPWFAYSFGRSGRWKKYEGRMCSHALALQYQAQSEGMFGKDIKEQPASPGWDTEITHYTPPPPKEWRASFDPLLVADDSADGAMMHTELPPESRNPYVAFSVEPPNVGNFFQSEFSAVPEDDSSVLSGTPGLDHISHVVELSTGVEMRNEVHADRTMARMAHLEVAGVSNEVGIRPPMRPDGLTIDSEAPVASVVGASSPVPTFVIATPVDMGPEAFFERQLPSHAAQYSTVAPTPATRVATRLFGGKPNQPRADDGKWTDGMGDKPDKGYGKITPGEARGDSKKVTPQEFDALADRGKAHYERLLADKRPTTAFDDEDKWKTIRSGAYDAAQKSWGGQTIDPETGRAIERSTGYSLEVRAPGEKQLSVPEDADEDTFNAMMDQAREEYAEKLQGSEVYLGVFRDDDNNRIDFDPVTIVATTAEVDALGAYTHAVGGAYDFSTGNGHFPPHVASLSSDVKDAVKIWSTIKVNNQKALPNPEHDGFRYAFHQILGDVGTYRYNASNPDFLKGEHEATTFLESFIKYQVPTHHRLYRAMGLHPDAYMTILKSADEGSLDLPPASWSINKKLTEQFGLSYEHGTKTYEERIIFVTEPGASSWALGRTSQTGYEREHIVGGRFKVVSIKFPPEADNTTIITLQEEEDWPEDFGATGDLIEHMAFDSAVVSPQDAGKIARYLTLDEARAGAFDYSIPTESAKVDPHKGTMIAVRPPDVVCNELALTDPDAEPVDQLHVTLAYIGPDESEDLDLDLLRQIVEAQAQLSPYIVASLSGHGVFENPEGDVSVVLVDSEPLQVARELLVAALDRVGIEISRLHSFTPHITLTYGDHEDLDPVDQQPFYFTEFIISPPSGEWERYELATNISLGAALVVADQENPIPPSENAEPSWGSTLIDQDDPTGSPMDSDGGVDTVMPGAQAAKSEEVKAQEKALRRHLIDQHGMHPQTTHGNRDHLTTLHERHCHSTDNSTYNGHGPTDGHSHTATLDEEPEGALPSTDGDAGADGAQSDQDYYPTDEQDNTHLYGGDDGAADTSIRGGGDTTVASRAWLDPSISSEVVKGHNDMDIAAAARNYLMTSTAVKSFTYAEQQDIINEGEGITASNLDRLRLEGTHYEQLEEQLAHAEAAGEPIIWW